MKPLVEAYASGRLLLFVGAGVSMTLGLPSWQQMIGRMADELGYDREEYLGLGSALTLAEYYRLKHGHVDTLLDWMDREWHAEHIDVSRSRVHRLLAESDLDLIYTTNYDRWIERAFEHHGREYRKIVAAKDLVGVPAGVAQIIKLHGDFDDARNMVLDETSHFQRMELESPLDIKLRADLLGRSALFIGYSLADINIRYLFFKLSRLWRDWPKSMEQPRYYVFTPQPNPVQQVVLAQWNIEMLSAPNGDAEQSLTRFLEELFDGGAESHRP